MESWNIEIVVYPDAAKRAEKVKKAVAEVINAVNQGDKEPIIGTSKNYVGAVILIYKGVINVTDVQLAALRAGASSASVF